MSTASKTVSVVVSVVVVSVVVLISALSTARATEHYHYGMGDEFTINPQQGYRESPSQAMTDHPQACVGEKLTFRLDTEDVNDRRRKMTVPCPPGTPVADWETIAGNGPYEIKWTIDQGAVFDSESSTSKEKTTGIKSGNVYVFIKHYTAGPITVTATARDLTPTPEPADHASSGSSRRDYPLVRTWVLSERSHPAPTTITTEPDGVQWKSHGQWYPDGQARYRYKLGPDAPPAYVGQIVEEAFGKVTSGGYFTLADIDPAWLNDPSFPERGGISTAEQAAAVIFNSGNNSVFVIDYGNHIKDGHGGFGSTDPFTQQALMRGIGYRLPQWYRACNNNLGTYTIDRKCRYTVDASGAVTGYDITINKTGG